MKTSHMLLLFNCKRHLGILTSTEIQSWFISWYSKHFYEASVLSFNLPLTFKSLGRHIQFHFSPSSFPPSLRVNMQSVDIPPPTARRTASSRLCQLGRPWRWQHARHAERSAWIRPFWAAAAPADARCELPSACKAPPWQQVASWPMGGSSLPDSNTKPPSTLQHTHKYTHTFWLLTLLLQPEGASAQLLIRMLHHFVLFYSHSPTTSVVLLMLLLTCMFLRVGVAVLEI